MGFLPSSLSQVDDSSASGVSPLPALPAYPSSLSLLTFTPLPGRLPHPSHLAVVQPDEGRQCPGAAGVLLPPRRPQVCRGKRKQFYKRLHVGVNSHVVKTPLTIRSRVLITPPGSLLPLAAHAQVWKGLQNV